MVKKMFVSLGVMSVIVIFILLIFVTGSTFGKIEDEEEEIIYSFLDDDYYYHLSDQEIETAIVEGIGSLNSLEKYLLAEKNNTLTNKEDVLFSYIETPKLTVINLARSVDHQYSRKIRTSEAKLKLTDKYLPVVIRFQENKGYIYDVYLKQGEKKIAPNAVEVKNNGEMVKSYFLVEEIDFKQGGELHVIDSLDEEISIIFQIDFSSYE